MSDEYLKNLLGEREDILLVTRQHWFVLARAILPETLTLIAMTILISIVVFTGWAIFMVWAYILLIIPLISLIRDTMLWMNHKYIVTNRRVIQIFGVFSKNVTDSSLEKVNDVKMDQSVLGRLFDYADIEILTASELGINKFTKIGNPAQFKTAMLNAKAKLEQPSVVQTSSSALDIPTAIAQLDSLRKQNIITETEFQTKKSELLAKL